MSSPRNSRHVAHRCHRPFVLITLTPCLQDLFTKYGDLRDVYRPNDYYTQAPKRFAFVEYLNSAHATKAREELDGTTQFGEPMSIQEAKHGRKNKDDMRAR
jgi:RNA recognition motif-containing protein